MECNNRPIQKDLNEDRCSKFVGVGRGCRDKLFVEIGAFKAGIFY
jgi:hypothetical protein